MPTAGFEWCQVWWVAAFVFELQSVRAWSIAETLELIENVELQVPLDSLTVLCRRSPTTVMLKVASLVFEGQLLAISPCVFDTMTGLQRNGHIQNRERIGLERRESHG